MNLNIHTTNSISIQNLNNEDGKDGKDGTDGKDAPPISVEAITQVLMDALGPALTLIDNPTDAIWDVILKATRERLAQLFNAQLEAL